MVNQHHSFNCFGILHRTQKRLNEFTLIDIKTCHGAALFPPRRRHVPNFLWRRMRHYRADPTFSTNLIIYLSRKIHFLLHHRQQGQGQLWGWKLISSSFGANQVWLKSTLAQIEIGTKQIWQKSNLAHIKFGTNQMLLKGFKCQVQHIKIKKFYSAPEIFRFFDNLDPWSRQGWSSRRGGRLNFGRSCRWAGQASWSLQ